MMLKFKLKRYIKKNLKKDRKKFTFRPFKTYKKILDADEVELFKSYKKENIHNFIKENKNKYSNFQTLLFNMIDERGLKDNEVYNKVHLDRRLFSKIRSDKNYHPSKETVILLGISLELNESEIEKLLDSASYSLPKNNYYDLIIRFCFINEIYNLNDINDLLDEYECKLLGY